MANDLGADDTATSATCSSSFDRRSEVAHVLFADGPPARSRAAADNRRGTEDIRANHGQCDSRLGHQSRTGSPRLAAGLQARRVDTFTVSSKHRQTCPRAVETTFAGLDLTPENASKPDRK